MKSTLTYITQDLEIGQAKKVSKHLNGLLYKNKLVAGSTGFLACVQVEINSLEKDNEIDFIQHLIKMNSKVKTSYHLLTRWFAVVYNEADC